MTYTYHQILQPIGNYIFLAILGIAIIVLLTAHYKEIKSVKMFPSFTFLFSACIVAIVALYIAFITFSVQTVDTSIEGSAKITDVQYYSKNSRKIVLDDNTKIIIPKYTIAWKSLEDKTIVINARKHVYTKHIPIHKLNNTSEKRFRLSGNEFTIK